MPPVVRARARRRPAVLPGQPARLEAVARATAEPAAPAVMARLEELAERAEL